MCRSLFSIGLAFGLLSAVVLRADGLVHRLPEDGAWARYKVTVVDREGDMDGHMMIRSVGRAVVDGQDCRWIEWEFETDHLKAITKLLIPETFLQSGHNPLDHVVRGWEKLGDRTTRRLDGPATAGLLPYLMHPPLRDCRKLDSTEMVDWQHGRLECEVRAGGLRLERATPNRHQRAEEVSYEVGLHDKAPFGVAFARLAIRVQGEGRGETVIATIIIADAGRDARSRLPEFR